MNIISSVENNQGYFQDILIDQQIILADQSSVNKEEFDLKTNRNFQNKGKLSEFFNKISRKNILKFGIMTGEEAIRIEDAKGDIVLPIINQEQIIKRIRTLKEEERTKIQYIHLSTIQIIIKSTFIENIDSPMKLELIDDRIIHPSDAIIAKGNCNLKQGKIKFDINLQIGMSLRDKDLSRSITINYEFLRKDLFREGNYPFTISYQINYALSNSHHSIEFKNSEKIYIKELFQPLVKLETPKLPFQLSRRSFLNKNKNYENLIGKSSRINRPLNMISNNEENYKSKIESLKTLFHP